METWSPPPCPNTVTVRRNPHRKARPTTSTKPPVPPSSSSDRPEIAPFPIDDILSIQINQNPQTEPSSSSKQSQVSQNLKVYLRIRPLVPFKGSSKSNVGDHNESSRNKNVWPRNAASKTKNSAREKCTKNKSGESCIMVNDSQSVTLSPPPALQDSKRTKSEVYQGFSHVFSADSSQNEVYEKMVSPLVKDFLEGKSGMLTALGPSGSGKTHTVFGTPREPGMVPLALQQIFKQTDGSNPNSRLFYISIFEIYSERGKGERIFDLSPDGADLSMQRSTIKGLQEAIISDASHAESLIASAILKRATAMTNTNSQSSRSQCIINIRSVVNKVDGEVDLQSNDAILTIVDLAGAEREKRTGNQGTRLLESNFINNTSMVFGLCLRSLLEHQKNPKKPLQKHFQNSLLTRYLRDYLEGKKRMALILTIRSGGEDYPDTSHVLRQASPYMKIKFDNVEEPSNLLRNKRHFQISSRTEQLKKMKFCSLDVSGIEEGRSIEDEHPLSVEGCVASSSSLVEMVNDNTCSTPKLPQLLNKEDKIEERRSLEDELSEEASSSSLVEMVNDNISSTSRLPQLLNKKDKIEEGTSLEDDCPLSEEEVATINKLDATDSTPLESDCSALEKSGRHHRIMQSFAKATWNVLKEYRDKLKLAESEIQNLSENLRNEKTKYFELEKELKDLKSRVCTKESVADGHIGEVDPVYVDEASEFNNTPEKDYFIPRQVEDVISQVNARASPSSSKEIEHEKDEQEIHPTFFTIVAEECANKMSSGKKINADKLDESKSLAVVHTFSTEDVTGCVASSSSLVEMVNNNTGSTSKLPQLLNKEDQEPLELSIAPEKDIALTQESTVFHAPTSQPTPDASCKSSKLEKPKRRLLPASTILLRDIGALDVEDETEKSRGNRVGKKLIAGETKRTQGSISLLRLLKSNLHLTD